MSIRLQCLQSQGLGPPVMRKQPDLAFIALKNVTHFLMGCDGAPANHLSLPATLQEGVLALADTTLAVTAILEAGRLSLDAGGTPVEIEYDEMGQPSALEVLSLQ